ncbi:MAG: hypothetical protein ACREHD_16130 [Pirellulales bacterium]
MDEHNSNCQPNDAPSNAAPATAAAADLESALNDAIASESYVVAVWHVAEGRVHFYRETNGFPLADLPEAERLLHDDFLSIRS